MSAPTAGSVDTAARARRPATPADLKPDRASCHRTPDARTHPERFHRLFLLTPRSGAVWKTVCYLVGIGARGSPERHLGAFSERAERHARSTHRLPNRLQADVCPRA
ncbi:hypothetical protein MKOR_38590 [Mycolicibacillus koreensis]|nr:hypothetical protein MKOR_38590 [Mycolicibacillus koreensis]